MSEFDSGLFLLALRNISDAWPYLKRAVFESVCVFCVNLIVAWCYWPAALGTGLVSALYVWGLFDSALYNWWKSNHPFI